MSDATGRSDGDADAKLDEKLAGVRRDVPPQRDLWPGIAARLEPRTTAELEALDAADGSGAAPPARAADEPRVAPRPRRSAFGAGLRWPYALAAGVGVVALAALLAVGIGQRGPDGSPVQAANDGRDATPAAAGERPRTLLAAAFEAPQDERYRRTRAAMEESFREGLAVLAPETRTRIEQNLELIRRANADIRAALAADPNSTLLHQLLESTWQQEIDLYTTVSRNVDPALARNET